MALERRKRGGRNLRSLVRNVSTFLLPLERRSAARSALRHATRLRFIRSQVLAILFAFKLRRRVRLRRGLYVVSFVEPTDASLPRGPCRRRE